MARGLALLFTLGACTTLNPEFVDDGTGRAEGDSGSQGTSAGAGTVTPGETGHGGSGSAGESGLDTGTVVSCEPPRLPHPIVALTTSEGPLLGSFVEHSGHIQRLDDETFQVDCSLDCGNLDTCQVATLTVIPPLWPDMKLSDGCQTLHLEKDNEGDFRRLTIRPLVADPVAPELTLLMLGAKPLLAEETAINDRFVTAARLDACTCDTGDCCDGTEGIYKIKIRTPNDTVALGEGETKDLGAGEGSIRVTNAVSRITDQCDAHEQFSFRALVNP